MFISEFVVDSFNYSHVETYTCLVNVAGLTFSERDYKILRINRNCKYTVLVILLTKGQLGDIEMSFIQGCFTFRGSITD